MTDVVAGVQDPSVAARPCVVARVEPSPSLLHRLFWVPSAAVNLAVLRIVVFVGLAYITIVANPVAFHRLPSSLVVAPGLLGDLVAGLPRSEALLRASQVLVLVACALAALGWRTRLAAATAASLSIYVLGVPQLFGKVDHYHHLVWLAVLLACTPCGDALSVDARGRERPPSSAKYGFPLRVAWVLIGFCYLFPGLAKLFEWSVWTSPENMRSLLDLQQWAANGGMSVPHWALTPAAVGTVVFEVGFVFAVFNRRLRPWALCIGIAFHWSTYLTMHIHFLTLQICYVAFIDWSRFSRNRPPPRIEEPTRASKIAAAALVLGTFVTGASFLVSAWPFASYPTFAGDFRGSTRAITVEVAAVTDGRAEPVEVLAWLPASRRPAVIWNALGRPEVLARLGRDAAPGADTIEVWAVAESTRSATRGRVVDRKLLLEAGLGR